MPVEVCNLRHTRPSRVCLEQLYADCRFPVIIFELLVVVLYRVLALNGAECHTTYD